MVSTQLYEETLALNKILQMSMLPEWFCEEDLVLRMNEKQWNIEKCWLSRSDLTILVLTETLVHNLTFYFKLVFYVFETFSNVC